MTTRKTFRQIGNGVLISGLLTTLWAGQTDSSKINKVLSDAKQQALNWQHDSEPMVKFGAIKCHLATRCHTTASDSARH